MSSNMAKCKALKYEQQMYTHGTVATLTRTADDVWTIYALNAFYTVKLSQEILVVHQHIFLADCH